MRMCRDANSPSFFRIYGKERKQSAIVLGRLLTSALLNHWCGGNTLERYPRYKQEEHVG
jgi:hypothetical protein